MKNLRSSVTFQLVCFFSSLFAITLGPGVAAHAQTVSEIYGFYGYTFAYGGLVADSAGNLYGTTNLGGTGNCHSGCGTIFELSPNGTGWTGTVLYNFAGGTDASYPAAGLVLDTHGNLYGTAYGGSATCGCGTVFRLSPATGGGWTESILYNFSGKGDGALPQGPLVFDSIGNLYGATFEGGTFGGTCGEGGCGLVFKLSPASGGTWTQTVLHAFSGGSDGRYPVGAVTLAGNTIYGATSLSGTLSGCGGTGCGVIFKLSQSATGWKETVLHSFHGGSDGSTPPSGPTLDAAGDLFGVTSYGGSTADCAPQGCGLAFRLSSSSGWKETVLHAFTHSDDGAYPVGPLSFDAAGNIFGESVDPVWCNSFISTCGVVFKLSPEHGGWDVGALYKIPGEWGPSGGLLVNTAGDIFGMGDGSSETGVSGVFEITP